MKGRAAFDAFQAWQREAEMVRDLKRQSFSRGEVGPFRQRRLLGGPWARSQQRFVCYAAKARSMHVLLTGLLL